MLALQEARSSGHHEAAGQADQDVTEVAVCRNPAHQDCLQDDGGGRPG